MGRCSDMPEVYAADLPYWDSDANKQIKSETYFLLPFETLDKMMTDDNIEHFTSVEPDSALDRTMQECRSRMGLTETEPVVACSVPYQGLHHPNIIQYVVKCSSV